MTQKKSTPTYPINKKQAKRGNTLPLILAAIALLIFIAVVIMQYSELNFYKN